MSTVTLELPRPAQRPLLSPETRTLIALGLAHALLECYSGVWPIYKHLAGLDLTTAGIVAAVTTALSSILQPVFGHWADRGWARTMVLGGTGLTFLMCLLGPAGLLMEGAGDVPLFALLALLVLLARLGHSAFHPAGASLASVALRNQAAAGLGIFVALGWAGFALSQLAFSSAYLHFGGHTEILILPGLLMMAWIVAWCRLTPAASTSSGDGIMAKVAAVWRLRHQVGGIFVLLCMLSGVNTAFFFLLPELLESKGYADWIVNGGAQGLLMGGVALGVVLGGYAADRFGVRRMLVTFMALNAIAFQGFLLLPHLRNVAFAPLCLLAGLMMGAGQPLPVSMAQRLVPQYASLITGVMMGWTWSVGSLTPPLAAWMAESSTFGTSGALSIVGIMNLVAFALAAMQRAAPEGRA